MTDDQFDDDRDQLPPALHEAARAYNDLGAPPREAIWQAIAPDVEAALGARDDVRPLRAPRRRTWMVSLGVGVIGLAAGLLIGLGLGRRATPGGERQASVPTPPATGAAPARARYDIGAIEHLSRTEAFLVAFRADAGAGRISAESAARARELLSATRLLLDSPATDDARLKALFEDLELVLAQIAQLSGRRADELQLVTDAMKERDVLPRLRTVVPPDPVAGT